MINYLKSEIYRMLQTKSTYFIPVGLTLFLFFMLGLTWFTALDNPNFPYNNAAFLFLFLHYNLSVVSFLIPFIVHKIFANEYGNGTFKNSISYGVNRKTLYFGKLILMVAYSILVATIVVVLYIVGTNLIMESGTTADIESQQALIDALIRSLPPLLALLSFSHMLSFVVKKTSTHWGIYFLVVMAFPTILSRLQYSVDNSVIDFLLNLTPTHLLVRIGQSSLTGFLVDWRPLWFVLVVYMVVSTVIGLKSFKNQDV